MALLDAIADPLRLQIVRRLAGSEPQTLSELAEALDVHFNTVRTHVADLEEVGVLVGRERPGEGRGRRPTEYSLADDQVLASSDLSGLSELLAAAVARSGLDEKELVALGAEWGRFLAGRPGMRDPLEAVPEALERLGFDARATESAIEVHGCPCSVLSPDRPEVICHLTHGVIEGALAASGSPRRVARYINEPRQRTCRAVFRKDG
jgi:predicted ArsR family transcriptional regulator